MAESTPSLTLSALPDDGDTPLNKDEDAGTASAKRSSTDDASASNGSPDATGCTEVTGYFSDENSHDTFGFTGMYKMSTAYRV